MSAKLLKALVALAALALPLVLTGNAVWLLLAGSWFVDFQYALPGFPVDPDGVQDPARTELAQVGVASVRPLGEGVELLREARLPGGAAAFDAREVQHMADVRELMTALLVTWAIAAACLAATLLALHRLAAPGTLARALRLGALVTIGAMAVLGLFMAVAFETFFDGFHGIFFAGDSWRFADTDTLRQLYPDAFWGIAGATVAVLVLAQAVALALVARALSSSSLYARGTR